MKKGNVTFNLKTQNQILKLIIVVLICAFSFYSFMNSEHAKAKDSSTTDTELQADTYLNLIDAQNVTNNYRLRRPDQAYAFQISKEMVDYAKSEMDNDSNIKGYRCYYGIDGGGNSLVIFRELNSDGQEVNHYSSEGSEDPEDEFDDENQVEYAAMSYTSYDKFPYAFPCPDFCDKSNIGTEDPYIFD